MKGIESAVMGAVSWHILGKEALLQRTVQLTQTLIRGSYLPHQLLPCDHFQQLLQGAKSAGNANEGISLV